MSTLLSAPPATTSRYPKRKRDQVRYNDAVEEESESGDDSEDSDTGSDVSEYANSRKRTKTRKTQAGSFKPLPKHKIFPFLSLPAELRNRIYDECLPDTTRVDRNGVRFRDQKELWFCSKSRFYRRGVQYINELDEDQVDTLSYGGAYYVSRNRQRRGRGRWPYQGGTGRGRISRNTDENSEDEKKLPKPRGLCMPLLAVCKQIYHEAAPLLYSQNLVFTDSAAMMNFASRLSPRTALLLRNIRIQNWISTRSRKSTRFAAMAVLAAKGATNLEGFHIENRIGWFSTGWSSRTAEREQKIPKRVARQVYRDCYPWLEAVMAAKGADFAIDVLGISEENFQYWNGDFGDAMKMYKRELRRLLGAAN
ncbi:hypothetical protein BCR34DRAFT_258853 [Clohesyomyces aquaticus]|uniref:DUF7730 domain-containing protein n=1 Tax=Clohesyomyces aquaticus TaxID=1231657 RepID=A0A1Y2A9F6_9PLEO|nr:hypothetical protein BCR34DRAFT_258853 [Clohesyomyces aquaticus]